MRHPNLVWICSYGATCLEISGLPNDLKQTYFYVGLVKAIILEPFLPGFSPAREDSSRSRDGHLEGLELAGLGGSSEDAVARHGPCHLQEHRGDGPCPQEGIKTRRSLA